MLREHGTEARRGRGDACFCWGGGERESRPWTKRWGRGLERSPRDSPSGLTSGIPSWRQAARKLCRFLRPLEGFSFGCCKGEESVGKAGKEAQPARHAQAAAAISATGAKAALLQE